MTDPLTTAAEIDAAATRLDALANAGARTSEEQAEAVGLIASLEAAVATAPSPARAEAALAELEAQIEELAAHVNSQRRAYEAVSIARRSGLAPSRMLVGPPAPGPAFLAARFQRLIRAFDTVPAGTVSSAG